MQNLEYNQFDYANVEDAAEQRFKNWQSVDPFPKIRPALLNSADIADYVLITGMVWPFYAEQLKSAAYEMRLGNEFLYWDEKGNKIHSVIEDSDSINLKKNSITYVTLKETFLVPDYMALRFNLTINHVHRGLLLGTGPLVNPGFQGKLMVPIHNLTPNEYPLRPGDRLISVEFTKLSPVRDWRITNIERPDRKGQYVPKHKIGLPFIEYIDRALPHGVEKVESSLSHALDAANDEIRTFREEATKNIEAIRDNANNEIKRSGLYRNIVSAATLAGVGALAWMTWQIFQSNYEFISQGVDKKNEIYTSLTLQTDRISRLETELHELKISNEKLSQNGPLQAKIVSIELDIKNIKKAVELAKTQLRLN